MIDQISSEYSDLIEAVKKSIPLALTEASETDSPNLFPEKTLQCLKDSNIFKACISTDFGGRVLGLKEGSNQALLTILKLIGSGNLVVGRIIEGHFNAQLLIGRYGTFDQKKRFAKDSFDGKLFGVWNTQAEDGVSLKFEKGRYHLNGSKTFATGTDYVFRPIVTASSQRKESWQMCIVDLDEVSLKTDSTWWNPMGMKATRSYKVTFNNIPLPQKNLLGLDGNYYEQPFFSGGSVRFSAVQLGAAEILLAETILYLQKLKRTDDSFQKMRIGQMRILVNSGNQWLKAAAESIDVFTGVPSAQNSKLFLDQSNMVRIAIDDICTEIMMLCQKCIGARGLNKPHHFERIIRDLNTYLRQPAPDHTLLEIGKFALGETPPVKNSFIKNIKKWIKLK